MPLACCCTSGAHTEWATEKDGRPTRRTTLDPDRHTSERTLLFLIGAVQFVNILDFMMVMPLGPDFAVALHIPTSELGLIGGSYTAAAAVGGLVASRFLDRFDRRSALALALVGLFVGTAAGGFATGLRSLMAARVLAGLFGGPATAISFAIVTDVVPPERRGRALGAVMGAFSVSSVLGVPAGLELSRLGGWRLPFFATAGLGLLIATLSLRLMPKLRSHIAERAATPPRPARILPRPHVFLSLLATATLTAGNFLVIPNLATFLQYNLGYPREHLGLLYLAGGTLSFFAMRLVGALVDRKGAPAVAAVGTAGFLAVMVTGVVHPLAGIPVVVFFAGFMVSSSFRIIALNAQSTRVPLHAERAGFMSMQTAVRHTAAAAGAFLSTQMLHELPNHHLEGMELVGTVSVCIAAMLPLLLWMVERWIPAGARVVSGPRAARPEKA